MAVPTRAELDVKIREKLAEDPAFRERLLAAPHTALTELTGVQVPEFITVTVHEESLTDVHLVLPPLLGDEIAEEDLEMVAGGAACWEDSCTSGP